MTEPPIEPLRVVLVDDNPDDRLMAQVAIRREYPDLVTSEPTEATALQAALRSADHDIVITDYNLRWTNGIEVLQASKQIWPDRPVVMLTGSGSEEIAAAAMRAGLDDYVLKGARRAQRLPAVVRAALARVRERRELAASQERYRQLFEAVPIGLFRTDGRGVVEAANPALAASLGVQDSGEVVGRAWRDLWSDPRAWDRWLGSLAPGRPAEPFEGRVRRPDGEMRSLEIDARASFGPDGAMVSLEGTVIDATQRRAAEDALRTSEARKTAMLEAAIDAVIAIDEVGHITEFNPAAERMFGHRRAAVLGRELAEVILPQDLRDRHRAGLARYVETGQGTILGRRVEMRAATAAGEIPVELAINRIAMPGPPAFIGYVRDISHRRQLEQSARERQRMEAIGQLAGGVAHDFNNMLTVIGGYSALLQEELDASDPRRELVDSIEEATSRAKALTRQLLAFSRRQVLRPQPVDLGHLVHELLALIRRVVPEDIVTTVNPAPEPVVAEIDPTQLEQVILNLVVNARDAMPSGGTLTLETAAVELDETYARGRPGATPGRYAMIAVSDTGVGMSPDVQARIFEPFFTTKEVGKGTGLGLAMAYGTVKQSGGDIRVYSEPDHGTTIRLYLPLSDTGPAPVEAPAVRPEPSLRPGTTVLVVEDEEQVRQLLVRALVDAGCVVFTAADGTDALTTVDPAVPLDLVITDVIMPGRNGPELIRILREMRPDVRVLFISGYAPQFATSRGLGFDATANFLQKPFTLTDLIAAVRTALDATHVPEGA